MVTYTKRMHKLSKRGRKQGNRVNRRTLRLCDDHWNNDNIVDRFLYQWCDNGLNTHGLHLQYIDETNFTSWPVLVVNGPITLCFIIQLKCHFTLCRLSVQTVAGWLRHQWTRVWGHGIYQLPGTPSWLHKPQTVKTTGSVGCKRGLMPQRELTTSLLCGRWVPETSWSFLYWESAPRWRLHQWLAKPDNPAINPHVTGSLIYSSLTWIMRGVPIGK